ncbi:MAG: flagellar hook protein FlgE [Alphaproteobacteria bacterium]|nr:flagellar hook protein FlgE [Alphaproteobacteria bacterium]
MSIFGALNTGVTGLNAQAQQLSAISNNIANATTIGYKRVDNSFISMVTTTGSQGSYSPGGARASVKNLIDAQGSTNTTTSSLDLAIQGRGFFVVRPGSDSTAVYPTTYTRAGDFRPDAEGYLKNSKGFYLQAWPLTNGTRPPGFNDPASTVSVNIKNIAGQVQQTTSLSMVGNLNSSTPTSGTAPSIPASGAPVASLTTTDTTIYDSLGNPQTVRIYWEKVATNRWRMSAGLPNAPAGNALIATPAAAPFPAAPSLNGSTNSNALIFQFNTDGTLASVTQADAATGIATTGPSVLNPATNQFNVSFNFSGSGGSANQTIPMNFGAIGSATGMGQFNASNSAVVTQDGARFGSLSNVSVSDKGIVVATFDNGQTRNLYEIPVADFPNVDGLSPNQDGVYDQTIDSGQVDLKVNGINGVGTVLPSALEQSTVDIAQEFSNLIVTEKAFNANTKVIKTSDDMLRELLQVI